MSITLSPPPPAEQRPEDRHWTVEEFYRAAAAGQIDDPDRLELVHGRLNKVMQGDRHANLCSRLSRQLRRALDPPLFARDEKPIHIAFDGEPIPDVMFTYQEQYEGRHPFPEDVALLVEVSDTSAAYDLGEKALLYSQAGITDYWVVLVNEAAIVRHRQPTSEGYQQVTRLAGADTLSPLVVPEAIWTVNALLEREGAPEGN